MSHSNVQRMTVYSGVIAVVTTLIAFLAFTKSGYPDSNDSARKIAAYFVQHRDATLIQQFLLGLSSLAVVCFIGGIVTMMWREQAARPLATVAAVAGGRGGAVVLCGGAVFTLLSH